MCQVHPSNPQPPGGVLVYRACTTVYAFLLTRSCWKLAVGTTNLIAQRNRFLLTDACVTLDSAVSDVRLLLHRHRYPRLRCRTQNNHTLRHRSLPLLRSCCNLPRRFQPLSHPRGRLQFKRRYPPPRCRLQPHWRLRLRLRLRQHCSSQSNHPARHQSLPLSRSCMCRNPPCSFQTSNRPRRLLPFRHRYLRLRFHSQNSHPVCRQRLRPSQMCHSRQYSHRPSCQPSRPVLQRFSIHRHHRNSHLDLPCHLQPLPRSQPTSVCGQQLARRLKFHRLFHSNHHPPIIQRCPRRHGCRIRRQWVHRLRRMPRYLHRHHRHSSRQWIYQLQRIQRNLRPRRLHPTNHRLILRPLYHHSLIPRARLPCQHLGSQLRCLPPHHFQCR